MNDINNQAGFIKNNEKPLLLLGILIVLILIVVVLYNWYLILSTDMANQELKQEMMEISNTELPVESSQETKPLDPEREQVILDALSRDNMNIEQISTEERNIIKSVVDDLSTSNSVMDETKKQNILEALNN